jgi:hypothetical protein
MIGSVLRYAPEMSSEIAGIPEFRPGYSDQHFAALKID